MIAVRVSDEMRVAAAASPAYLAQRGLPETPRDLAGHNCIRLRFPSGAIRPWRFGTRRRTFEVQVDGSLIVSESTIAVRAATDGVGLIQFPLPHIARELAAGTLVTVLDDWAPPPFDGFFLYYPSRRQVRPPLKALIDFLRDAHRGTSVGRKPAAAR